jgi:glycosyltransferase involved in cell wall biosynthesis
MIAPEAGGVISTPQPSHSIRVLRVADVPSGQAGGMRLAMASTSALLANRGHAIDHCFSEDLPSLGPRRCRRLLVPLLLPLRIMMLRAHGREPDIVEIHEPLGAPYALLRKLLVRRLPPMVALSHGLEERRWCAQKARWRLRGERGPLKSRVLTPVTLVAQARIALRLADAVVVLSSQDRDHLLRKRRVRTGRLHRVDNGVEEDLLTLPRASRPVDGRSVLLAFVGSWIDRKGTPELVEAFAHLYRDHRDARLVAAGTGASAAEVLSSFPPFVRDNVEVRQSLTRHELRELLSRADVFVLPSWFEGMPLSLLEAAAAGVPIVATDTCGIRDVLRPIDPDRDGGRLVPAHDAAALHAALDELVRDATLRVALGVRARARAHAFTWAASAAALERVYLAALDAR